MRAGLLVIVPIVLASCAAQMKIDPNLSGPFPNNYQKILEAHSIETYFDPHSLRDVSISSPDRGFMNGMQGWVVCMKANGKNRNGAYAGMQTTAYLIHDGVIVSSLPESPVCNYEKFVPWPEMQNHP